MQRVRVTEHRHRARLALRHVEQRFERARRARDLTQEFWRHSQTFQAHRQMHRAG